MQKQTWIIASLLSALALLGYLGLWMREQNSEMEKLHAAIEVRQGELQKTMGELNKSQALIEELAREKNEVMRAHQDMEREMRDSLQSKDVTISELRGKLTVDILDRILFDSGQAVLKPEGEQMLMKIAQVLVQYPKRQIHVIGHTDNVPIGPSARARFASNWELSTARATAAVRFLSEKAGVDPRRLGCVGYGEYHPIADNSSEEGRARNRRIALVVLSEDLVGSDAALPPPVIRPASGTTNAPASTNIPVVLTNKPGETAGAAATAVLPASSDATSQTNTVKP